MKLLVEFSHPAQVHKFKHVLLRLQLEGVEVLILSRDKDVMLNLLDRLPFRHNCISRARSGVLGGAIELLVREWGTLRSALSFKPDLMLSAHSVAITHVGWLLRIPRLVHEDTEFGTLQQRLYIPFASRVITSTAYYLDWGNKQTRIPSLEPLAYLHPNHFQPDSGCLPKYGLNTSTRYAVLRTISWQAQHDRGLDGMTSNQVDGVIKRLLEDGYERVVLSDEACVLGLGGNRVVRPEPEDLHHLLAFASLCISESITVAGEAAVLGAPALLINPLRAGHTLELERYGLIERFADFEQALVRSGEIARDPDAAEDIWKARQLLLHEKSDMSQELFEILLEELRRSRAKG